MSDRLGLVFVVLTFVACADAPAPAPAPSPSSLGSGVVATVAAESVSATTVARIAARRGVTLEEAREQALYDALMAAGARERLAPGEVAREEARLLAHALLRTLWIELRAAPISDAELEEATQVRWTHWDRPVGYRTVHLVVQVDVAKASPEQLAEARDLAERLRSVVQPAAQLAREVPAPSLDEEAMFNFSQRRVDDLAEKRFLEDAQGFDAGQAQVVVQSLPPTTAEGWVIDHETSTAPQKFDGAFAEAVAALGERGGLSQVFASSFGYHVALLLEVTPERRPSRAQRLEGLAEEIVRVRAKRAQRKLLERLRGEVSVELPSNVDGQLGRVSVATEGP